MHCHICKSKRGTKSRKILRKEINSKLNEILLCTECQVARTHTKSENKMLFKFILSHYESEDSKLTKIDAEFIESNQELNLAFLSL